MAQAGNPSCSGGRDQEDCVKGQLRQRVLKNPISPSGSIILSCMLINLIARGSTNRRITIHANVGKKPDPISKITNNNQKKKKGWRSGSGGRHLPSKHKALSSNPSTTNKKLAMCAHTERTPCVEWKPRSTRTVGNATS
jgi:hypothetical protein